MLKLEKLSTRREYNHAHQTQVTMNIARERNRTRASARSVSPRVGCDVISCPNQRGEMRSDSRASG